MKKYIYTLCVATALLFNSCFSDLDQMPMSEDSLTELDVFQNATEAKSALVKLYASFALTGQEGPAGRPDISGLDEGTTSFTRLLILMQDVPTDIAINAWGDAGVPNLNFISWGASNGFNEGMYYRLGQTVSFCNSFIENAEVLSSDGEVKYFIAEARFIRAFAYYYLLDFYGNVPVQTVVTSNLPEQNSRLEVFNFIESELLEVKSLLKSAGDNEYGRVDEVAAWALLSRLYLNAEVYTGTARYADCVTYSELAINSSYTLNLTDTNGDGSSYDELFCADNNSNGAQQELIFTANYDGNNSQSYGGTTFLVCANTLGGMDLNRLGVSSGWDGNKVCPELVAKFDRTAGTADAPTAWADKRAVFATTAEGREFAIKTIAQDVQGYGTYKFTNVRADGAASSHAGKAFVDTDFPLIRLGEIYLNYAEAVLRGGGGSDATALNYVNELRARAGAATVSSIDLPYLINERARELYFEGFRRSDLIRFNMFTSGDYLWTFKGGVQAGKAVDSKYELFPIPTSILNANENMKQNAGY
ncbi:MAG: RagB/SusD family nutrient uptake outer membrane protein [Mangrovibacterium sp.]